MTNRSAGNCWKALPEQEKKSWEARAKKAKAEHKEMYPNYRFKPVHNKNKNRQKKEKMPLDEPDERRCEEVAQLLLEGKKGDELAAAVRRLDLDRKREATGSASPMIAPYPSLAMPMPMYADLPKRRSSSVPPMHYHSGIAIPSVPSFYPGLSISRAESPVNNIARYRGHDIRRPSSAGPSYYGNWSMPQPVSINDLQQDHEPLPDINEAFMNPTWGGLGFTQDSALFVSHLPKATVRKYSLFA
jgi:hypothetical protein